MHNITTVDWYGTTNSTNTHLTIAAPTTGGLYTEARLAPKPPSRLRRWLSGLGQRALSERGSVVLPTLAGGSDEMETVKRVEAKKKIVLERKVGVPRDKGSGMQEIHKGTVELVRTLEGTDLEKSTIGLKVSPKDGTGHVEIPVDVLRAALDELDPPAPSDAGKS